MAITRPRTRRTPAIAQDILLTYGAYSQDGQNGARSVASTERLESRQNKRYLGSLAVVAETVGGGRMAANAGSMLVAQIVQLYYAGRQEDALACLQQAFNTANATNYAAAVRAGQGGQLGGNVLATAIVGSQAYIISIGHLRAYLVRKGQARPITRRITQTGQHGQSALFLGQGASLPLSAGSAVDNRFSFQQNLEPGDALVFCNDTVARALHAADIARLATDAPAAQAARQLVDQASAPGESVAAAVIQYGSVATRTAPRLLLALLVAISLIVLALAYSLLKPSASKSDTNATSIAETSEPKLAAAANTVDIPVQTSAATYGPTSLPVSTNTPLPTNTPRPSATPAPSATATPTDNSTPTSDATPTPSVPGETITQTVVLASTSQPASPPSDTPPPTVPTVAGGAQVSVSPGEGTLGDIFTINGNGFATNARINMWLTAPDKQTFSIRNNYAADAGGAIRAVTFNLPKSDSRDLIPGLWHITAHSSEQEAIASFTVRPSTDPSQIAHIAVMPGSGKATDMFSVEGNGFVPQEGINVWLTDSSGNQIVISKGSVANDDGILSSISFVMRELGSRGEKPGTWSVTAQGYRSKRIATATFNVSE